MRVVLQRIDACEITIDHEMVRNVGKGLLVLLGIVAEDDEQDIQWVIKKLCQLRIFDDQNGVMNLSVNDIKGDIMLVSQFTLHASTKKGNRPSYIRAAQPDIAKPIYEQFKITLEKQIMGNLQTGEFGAHMLLDFKNNGPVTMIIDSKNKE